MLALRTVTIALLTATMSVDGKLPCTAKIIGDEIGGSGYDRKTLIAIIYFC